MPSRRIASARWAGQVGVGGDLAAPRATSPATRAESPSAAVCPAGQQQRAGAGGVARPTLAAIFSAYASASVDPAGLQQRPRVHEPVGGGSVSPASAASRSPYSTAVLGSPAAAARRADRPSAAMPSGTTCGPARRGAGGPRRRARRRARRGGR